jgi:hypothetical protein
MKKVLFCGIALLFVLTACGLLDDGTAGQQRSEEKLFTITGSSTGALYRGSTRQFVVNPKYDVIWTVEGADPEGGTAITLTETKRGRLTVGKDETNRTFTVKATSVENPQDFNTITVTVDGIPAVWKELTDRLAGLITNKANRWKLFQVDVGDSSFGIHVLAYGEGVGPGKGRWVVGGGSDYHTGYSNGDYLHPVMAYSDDDGETWTEIHTAPALLYEETTRCLIYAGPPDDKKFILGTARGNIFWSYDGEKWTKFTDVFPSYTPANGIKYICQVLYGDIDANGGKGRYIAVNLTGRVTWSDDGGKTWVPHYADTDWRYVADCTGIIVQYGTGIIDSKREKMFFGAGYKGNLTNEVHCYSLDGIKWVTLDEDKVDAVAFEPNTPVGANGDISWKDEADTSTLLFATEVTEPYTSPWGGTDTLKEGPGVNKHARFVAYGNGKYLAVGLGRRLAWTDAETAKK